jgi:hypothetical protein
MFVYMWHEPRLNAVKIGYGNSPPQRMRDYANQYGLQFDAGTLVSIEVPQGIDCQVIENELHKCAEEIGLRSVTRSGSMQELFLLADRTYADVSAALRPVIEHVIGCVRTGNSITPYKQPNPLPNSIEETARIFAEAARPHRRSEIVDPAFERAEREREIAHGRARAQYLAAANAERENR